MAWRTPWKRWFAAFNKAQLFRQLTALWFLVRDARAPRAPKLVALLVLAYALSPIDLIPDFIPVLGLLDDLILLPLGVALAVRLSPRALWTQMLEKADQFKGRLPKKLAGLLLVLLVWLCVVVGLVLAFSSPAAATPHTWSGVVSHVVDGDTLHVRPAPSAEPRSVRILGIDAPESCQAHGQAARQALLALVLGRTVMVTTTQQDDYGRDLAVLHLRSEGGGLEDLGRRLVSAGHAWSYRFKQDPGPYAAPEAQARQERRGLFRESDAQYPGQFRRRHGPCLWEPRRP